MAPKPDRLVFVFGMVLAMAVTILAITTWAAPPKPESDSAAPISPRQTIYRTERRNLYKESPSRGPWNERWVARARPLPRPHSRLTRRSLAPPIFEQVPASSP